jgi:hypothetical protein
MKRTEDLSLPSSQMSNLNKTFTYKEIISSQKNTKKNRAASWLSAQESPSTRFHTEKYLAPQRLGERRKY